jgi:uncharacterized protein (TIGR02246 family)
MMARLSIEDLLARYVRWADAGRPREFAALFSEDCVYTVPDRVCRGRAAVSAFLDEMIGAFSAHSPVRLRHHVSSVVIEMQGLAEAKASAYFIAVGPHGPDHWGNYRDHLACIDGQWLFAERRVQIDGRIDGSVATRMD